MQWVLQIFWAFMQSDSWLYCPLAHHDTIFIQLFPSLDLVILSWVFVHQWYSFSMIYNFTFLVSLSNTNRLFELSIKIDCLQRRNGPKKRERTSVNLLKEKNSLNLWFFFFLLPCDNRTALYWILFVKVFDVRISVLTRQHGWGWSVVYDCSEQYY